MSAIDELKTAEADFYGVLQEMLESINLPSNKYDMVAKKLREVWPLYITRLHEAAEVSASEVAEHYTKMAREISLQVGFFTGVTDDYRKSRGL